MTDETKQHWGKADKTWADITRRWAAAGGESIAALNASLRASSKSNPLGQLKADDPVRKAR